MGILNRNKNFKLSPHFTLGELCATGRCNITNLPTTKVIPRLEMLCKSILEPIREKFGPVEITSGYRCIELNHIIGGVHSSAHVFGCAVDFVLLRGNLEEAFDWIKASQLNYDQVIFEHSDSGNWIHIGMLRPGYESKPRHEALKFDKEKNLYTRM